MAYGERFWSKVDRSAGPDACWPWTAAINPTDGYGYIGVGRKGEGMRGAHRVAYEETYGPVAQGLDVDHTCHNGTDCPGGASCIHRRCCNPSHLEAVTHRVNMLRGNTIAARNAAVTHCPHGHEYTPDNTRIESNGARKCRTCIRLRTQRWREARKRAAAPLATAGASPKG